MRDKEYWKHVMFAITTSNKPEPERTEYLGWGTHFIQAVKAIREIEYRNLRDTLELIASIFGFASWSELQPWLRAKQLDFSSVQGPHAFTILKAMAAKHGRHKIGTPETEREDQNED